MAKTYRGVKQPLTIDVKEPIPFKMTAMPSSWLQLRELFYSDRSDFDDIFEKALQDAVDIMPPPKLNKKVAKDDFDGAFDNAIRESHLKENGTFYRGKHKSNKDLGLEIADTAKWFYRFFAYWKKSTYEERTRCLKSFHPLLDVMNAGKANKRTWDAVALTMLCCAKHFGESPSAGKYCLTPFKNISSFRTTYLAKMPRVGLNLQKLSPEEVLQLTEKPEHPLHFLVLICRKLQN